MQKDGEDKVGDKEKSEEEEGPKEEKTDFKSRTKRHPLDYKRLQSQYSFVEEPVVVEKLDTDERKIEEVDEEQ